MSTSVLIGLLMSIGAGTLALLALIGHVFHQPWLTGFVTFGSSLAIAAMAPNTGIAIGALSIAHIALLRELYGKQKIKHICTQNKLPAQNVQQKHGYPPLGSREDSTEVFKNPEDDLRKT